MNKKRLFSYFLVIILITTLFMPLIIDRYRYYSTPSKEENESLSLSPSLFEQIQARKELHVGMLKSKQPHYALSYNIKKEPNNIDYELVRLFAQKIGVNIVLHEKKTLTALFQALNDNEIDIIASGLSLLPAKINAYLVSPPYQIASQHLIYRRGTPRPRSLQVIKDNIYVAEHSAQVLLIKGIAANNSNIIWKIKKDTLPEELAKMVATGEIKYTIIESTTLSRLQLLYPELAIAFTVQKSQPIGWQMKKSDDQSLSDAINLFMHSVIDNGIVENAVSKYYNHISKFDYVNIASLNTTIQNKLNLYREFFEKYAKENDLDWQILAAVSYQESHWNPKAVSPTGVRGIMMLTQNTAKRMGVQDRLDPEQSIRGGAAYIKKLISLVPQEVPKDDRIWYALTAYNMGIAHLYDLIKLAKNQKDNPYIWDRIKFYLPLMNESKHYSTLKYGKANGIQAYEFVQNIKLYKMVISSYLQENPTLLKVPQETETSSLKSGKEGSNNEVSSTENKK